MSLVLNVLCVVITLYLLFTPKDDCVTLDIVFDVSVLVDNVVRVVFSVDGQQNVSS